MKKFICTLLLGFLTYTGFSQQTFEIPQNYHNQFLNNPAATGVSENLDISAFYSKSFTNVDRAPLVMFGAAQYGSSEQNAAFGINVWSEKAGLLSNTGIAGTFAYKLRALANRNDFLAIGIGVKINSLSFSGSDAIVAQLGEPNLGSNASGLGTNFQIGAFYTSSSEKIGYRGSDDIVFQGGASLSQIGRATNLRSQYTYEDQYIFNGFLSAIVATDLNFIVRTYAEAVYENTGQLNVVGGARATLSQVFIAGVTLDSHLALGMEFGVNFQSANDDITTAVVNFNVPFNDISDYINPGIGLSLRYQIDASSMW